MIDDDYQKLTDADHKPKRFVFIDLMMWINLPLIFAIAVMWWMI